MPKRVHKISRFEGGVNESSDPRDLSDNEVKQSDNIIVDELGKLRLVGKSGSSLFTRGSSSNVTQLNPGHGIFAYSTDRAVDGSLANTDWIAVTNQSDGYVDLKHTTGGSSSFVGDAIDIGVDGSDANDNIEGSFYFADGVLRATEGNHKDNEKTTKWYGYVESRLFQTTKEATSGDLDSDGESQKGTPAHYISEWTSVDASLKKFSDLGVTIDLQESGSANPSSSVIGSSPNKIVIAYWKYEKGEWNGVYELGVTPIYHGGQEGPMDVHNETIVAADEKLTFQFYLPIGTAAFVTKNNPHVLADNRIIGFNVYFRPFGNEDWNLLTKVDLLSGGKHFWKVYNSDTDTASGIFAGTCVVQTPATTSGASGSNHYSYTSTTCQVNMTNTGSGFSGRSGFCRLQGFLATPLYATISNLASPGNITFNVVHPGEGVREYKAEILDEQFNIIKESDLKEVTLLDSGKSVPTDHSASNDPSS